MNNTKLEASVPSYGQWTAHEEIREEVLAPEPTQALRATLDDESETGEGCQLPPLWQWLYFHNRALQNTLGKDGHPPRGELLPPIALARRMFAGTDITFHRPLILGKRTQRIARTIDITKKHGNSSGELVFVKVLYQYLQEDRCCIEETQTVVYREMGSPMEEPLSLPSVITEDQSFSKIVVPSTTLLFRFSALTFNSHRIHYDSHYAQQEEGYPGLIVHGPLIAIQMAQFVESKYPDDVIKRFRLKLQCPLFVQQPYTLTLKEIENRQLSVEARRCDQKLAAISTITLNQP